MSKMTLEFDQAAEAKFYDIIDYYKQFDPSLPYDFIQEFEDTVQHLINFPEAGQPYLRQTKRVFLNRFPYSLVYKIYNDELIIVFAIMHMKRKPGYWEKRIK